MNGATARAAVPATRFCDIVMEGGITSGFIYTAAASELAGHYRFRNVGGSSIGAFAAALTAAAEYSRRNGSDKGFERLTQVHKELGKPDEHGRTGLRSLFTPQDTTRRLFEVFLATIGHRRFTTALSSGLAAALVQYRLLVLIALLTTAVLALGPLGLVSLGLTVPAAAEAGWHAVALGSWIGALVALFALVTAVALVAGILWDVLRGLVPNGFGLCRGWSAGNTVESKDLALFLYGAIQEAAGLDPKASAPLTFRDLWDAPDPPSTVLGLPDSPAARRAINLQIYATNLAHGRPYRFPLDDADDMGRLFFRLEEFQAYFPEPILRHLAAHARPYQPRGPYDPPANTHAEQVLELPREDLPVAVAARLALSFPFLISAVPLWAINYQQGRADRKLSKCWISDGGLCTNFPIHLFDSFLPKWPTFGISLHTRGKTSMPRTVWLPERHMQGRADLWHRIEGGRWSQLTGFLTGLWMATWRWNDMTMMRMPGVRDRVVRIFLEENEGGINIKMPPETITKLADVYGKSAAQAFVKKFAQPDSHGWLEHRWVRFNRLLIALREQMEGFEFSAKLKKHAEPLDLQIAASRFVAPLRGHPAGEDLQPSEGCLTEAQVLELKGLLAALTRLEAAFRAAGKHQPFKAIPRPSLRVRHPT